jgi:pimeloyl-ACP methyl ester carboxylesterase
LDSSAAPALILSGLEDPVTPPRWGELMARHFPTHALVVVPGAAHNASFTGCMPRLIAAFLDQGAASGEVACIAEVPLPPIVASGSGGRP